ncbi:MAG: DegT/DnrJ/EryC1/StrS family aminotransferase, partial [Promethearchaeota archaeon]
YKKLKLIRSHGRVDVPNQNYFSTIKEMEYVQIGYNYRMPSICAALGISQLNKIDKIIELRRKIGKYYDKELESIPGIQTIPEIEGSRIVYQLCSIYLKESEVRENLQDYLLKNGIHTKVYFYPIHLKAFYKSEFGYREGDLPMTEKISKKILTLPISLNFSKEDQDHIITSIKDYLSF